ncbi:MAG: dihydroorotate oxidase, partial [Candidatus Levybacteria bacterium]|nr:dihydroorotate oxidase [Candidatus Levybacteria bacterium]
MTHPFYDPTLSYDTNFVNGPSLSKNPRYPKRIITKQTKFLGFDVNMPFGMPAGPLLNAKFVKEAFKLGFDVNCYKTQRTHIVSSNKFPNILFIDVNGDLTLEKAEKPLVGKLRTDQAREKFSITNSFGNPSRGPQFWQKDMKKALSYSLPGQLLISSVCGTLEKGLSEDAYYEDFANAAKMAADTGVKVVELNLSCPNVATEGVVCYTENAVFEICKRAKEKIGNVHLIAKMGYFAPSQQELLERVVKRVLPFVSA